MLDDVLSILEFVHSQGVIHRDIKPENLIRRDRDNKFVLIDFGAVKTLGNTIAEATGETNLSMPIYTSGYGASEQCLGRPQFSSDLYSLGMVAIQTLTGMRPSQLPQDFNTSELVWRDQAKVVESLAAFLDKMICYHYIHRYQSALEARQALHQVVLDGGIPASRYLARLQKPTSGSALTMTPPLQTQFQPDRAEPQPKRHRFKRGMTLVTIASGAVVVALALAGLLRGLSPIALVSQTPSASETKPEPGLSSDRISAGEKLLSQWQVNPKNKKGSSRSLRPLRKP